MQGGKVWEKAGVGVSVVYGTMPPEAYRAAKGNNHNSKPATNGVRHTLMDPHTLCTCHMHALDGSCLGLPQNISRKGLLRLCQVGALRGHCTSDVGRA